MTTKFLFKLNADTGYEGVYEWDPSTPFTGEDWHLIKEVAGVRMGEFSEAISSADYDVIVAVAVIVLCRHGVAQRSRLLAIAKTLMPLDTGAVDFEEIEVPDEEDVRPPASATPPGTPSSNGEASVENVSSVSSSPVSSSTGVVPPETPPSPTGPLGLVENAG